MTVSDIQMHIDSALEALHEVELSDTADTDAAHLATAQTYALLAIANSLSQFADTTSTDLDHLTELVQTVEDLTSSTDAVISGLTYTLGEVEYTLDQLATELTPKPRRRWWPFPRRRQPDPFDGLFLPVTEQTKPSASPEPPPGTQTDYEQSA